MLTGLKTSVHLLRENNVSYKLIEKSQKDSSNAQLSLPILEIKQM